MKIEIIGSKNNKSFYTSKCIADLLNGNHVQLNYGSQFMGRPSTRIYSSNSEIVKLRSEIDLAYKPLRDWVLQTLTQERLLNVHHPDKTWFIVEFDDGPKAGNICPRLMPLHIAYGENSGLSTKQKLELMVKLYDSYFDKAANYNKRLDEGLSNFGLDESNQLFYLDDDIYSWDGFTSFVHFFGVLIRNNKWLDTSSAKIFGSTLKNLIEKYFPEGNSCNQVSTRLKDLFVPDGNQRKILEIFIETFKSSKPLSKNKIFNDRYIAIFADIHANLPALNAVLDYLNTNNIKQGIVLGDTIGYGPHPDACIDRLLETSYTVIKGNHDQAAATNGIQRGMSKTAQWCIEWTIPYLHDKHIDWIDNLPFELKGTTTSSINWLAIHGSPLDPSYCFGYVYEMTYQKNLDAIEQRNFQLCFHGHSHVQGFYGRQKYATSDAFFKESQSLQPYRYSLICPGSVGQPRDGICGAQFAVYDQKENFIQFLNIEYPLQNTIAAMKSKGFPDTLMTRLEKGY